MCRKQGPRSQTMAGGPGYSFPPGQPQDSAGTCVSVSWLEKALSKRKVLYLGGGVPGTWAPGAGGKRKAEVKVGRSSSISRTGLSWPRGLGGASGQGGACLWDHHVLVFCHWRRAMIKRESMKKTSMISMTQTMEQLIHRPSWPPKLDRSTSTCERGQAVRRDPPLHVGLAQGPRFPREPLASSGPEQVWRKKREGYLGPLPLPALIRGLAGAGWPYQLRLDPRVLTCSPRPG